MKAPTLMSIREIKHDIYENYPYAIPFIASIKQKKDLQDLLTDLRFANRSSSYSINTTSRQQDDMDIQQQINTNYNTSVRKQRKQKNRYSLDQDDMDIQQSYQQKRQRERAEVKRREEQRLARQARQRERAEARRREEQRLARQEAQKLAKAAREERQRKMRQQASRRNTTSSTTTGKKPRLTQQQIRQIENVVPGDFKLGAKTVQQLSDKNLKEKAVELTKKMTDKSIRKNTDIKVPTTRLLHAVNAEIVKRKL